MLQKRTQKMKEKEAISEIIWVIFPHPTKLSGWLEKDIIQNYIIINYLSLVKRKILQVFKGNNQNGTVKYYPARNKLLVYEQHQRISKACWMKEARHKIVHIIQCHLYDVQEQAKWIYGGGIIFLVGWGGIGWREWEISYLKLWCGSSSCTLKIVYFILGKLATT